MLGFGQARIQTQLKDGRGPTRPNLGVGVAGCPKLGVDVSKPTLTRPNLGVGVAGCPKLGVDVSKPTLTRPKLGLGVDATRANFGSAKDNQVFCQDPSTRWRVGLA
jgi:hypothetical protein